MAINLKSIHTGKRAMPERVVLAGMPGVGKSTMASQVPKPIFIPTEDGLDGIDCESFPMATKFSDVTDAIGALATEPHDYKTVVIDSMDWLENLAMAQVKIDVNNDAKVLGYGGDHRLTAEKIRFVLRGLTTLREKRGMTVILIAHSLVKRFDDPAGDSYDRYILKMNGKSSSVISEWADVVGFAAQQTVVREVDAGFGKKIGKGIAVGGNVLHLAWAPAYDAKCRYDMPAVIDLRWDAFASARKEGNDTTNKTTKGVK